MQISSNNTIPTILPPSTERTRGASVLIAPLNWGLGHASRCVPIVREQLAAGNRVTLAGDGDSLTLLRKHFPELPVLHLPHLDLRYSAGTSQVGAMLRSLPRLLWWMWQDHRALQEILSYQHFDVVISDNRLGLWRNQESRAKNQDSKATRHIYITHQLMIKMPRGWRWAEGLVHWLHGRVIGKYDECWVPDYAEHTGKALTQNTEHRTLSGDLAHKYPLPRNARFIGPLSRFGRRTKDEGQRTKNKEQRTIAVLSGLEPQRTLLEKELLERYKDQEMLLVRGKVNESFCKIQRGKVTIVPYLNDADLVQALLQAEKIIARSGYSTIMDLDALGVLDKAELIPTPGQTEQEYLAERLKDEGQRTKD